MSILVHSCQFVSILVNSCPFLTSFGWNLQGVLNFTYELRQPPDGQWGALQPDGSWSGMVNMLQKDEADIAATDFTVTKARSTVITFAQPITQIHHRLFIKNPTGSYNFKAYSEPFHYFSWIFLFFFCIVVPPVLFLTTR
jgi:ionotropic kainate glutamate receptor 5